MRTETAEGPRFRPPSSRTGDGGSLAELRQTVVEILRIVSVRRWLLFVPFCVVVTGGFLVSFTFPRRYEAVTTFERRDDPVLMNLPRAGGAGAFEIFRRTLVQDLTNPHNLVPVVEQLGLVEDAEAAGDERFADDGRAERVLSMATRISDGLKVSLRHKSEHLDVIEVRYATERVETMIPVLNEVRDNYVRLTQQRINRHLRETKDWFDRECAERQTVVDALRDDLRVFKAEHGGLDPLNPDAGLIELTNLREGLTELERKRRDLQIQLDGRLVHLNSVPSDDASDAAANLPQSVRRSARSIALTAELRRIESRIEELKTTRGMTDLHPEIMRWRRQWDVTALDLEQQKLQDAARTLADNTAGTSPHTVASTSPWAAARAQAEADVGVLRQLLGNADAEIQSQQRSIADIERCRAEAAQNYGEFHRRQAEIEHIGDDLALYRRYADQVGRLLEAENSQRGILFEKVIPAAGSRIPVSPRTITIVVLTMAAGLAVGVVILLFAELLDQTIRTRRQIAQTLGINILESIDVIVTSAVRRRRAVRKVLVPIVATTLVAAVALSGSLVYLSLEHRSTFERVIEWPRTAARRVMANWSGNQSGSQVSACADLREPTLDNASRLDGAKRCQGRAFAARYEWGWSG